jgi:hypothetical protein
MSVGTNLSVMEKLDPVQEKIAKIIRESDSPLETNEVIEGVNQENQNSSRSVILYRLNNLRALGEISGKQVGSGKGTWIWWYKQSKDRATRAERRNR